MCVAEAQWPAAVPDVQPLEVVNRPTDRILRAMIHGLKNLGRGPDPSPELVNLMRQTVPIRPPSQRERMRRGLHECEDLAQQMGCHPASAISGRSCRCLRTARKLRLRRLTLLVLASIESDETAWTPRTLYSAYPQKQYLYQTNPYNTLRPTLWVSLTIRQMMTEVSCAYRIHFTRIGV